MILRFCTAVAACSPLPPPPKRRADPKGRKRYNRAAKALAVTEATALGTKVWAMVIETRAELDAKILAPTRV